MITTTPIELRKIAYRQSAKDGLVITFACHPDDMRPELAAAPIGTRFMAALVEIGDDEQPVERGKQHPLVQKAAILCNDKLFQKFIEEEYPLDWEQYERAMATQGLAIVPTEITANILRNACNIQSRRELATNGAAARAFEDLTGKFEGWKKGL